MDEYLFVAASLNRFEIILFIRQKEEFGIKSRGKYFNRFLYFKIKDGKDGKDGLMRIDGIINAINVNRVIEKEELKEYEIEKMSKHIHRNCQKVHNFK